MTSWWCEIALLPDGMAEAVRVDVADGRITAVAADQQPGTSHRLPGISLPGLANVHSHAFHRVLRARTHNGAGDFWAWREAMYRVAERLDPDRYRRLARAVYAEMALAGITAVGEFHYLHHPRDGGCYADPNEMGRALLAAAAEAGIRITLLDTCYLHGGFDQPVNRVQRRFADPSAEAWAIRVGELADAVSAQPSALVAAAIHSVRAVHPGELEPVARWAAERGCPLHVHVSEQPAENEECMAAFGCTPTQLLSEHGALGPATTAVHAVHVTGVDVALLGAGGSSVCLCPTTERDLGDGVAPAGFLAAAGARLTLGSDSHAVVDLFEEARAVELDERLVQLRRGILRPEELLRAAAPNGMAALGWPDAGRIEPGARADLVTVGTRQVRLAGITSSDAAAGVVFAATAADVTNVLVDGRPVVADGRHLLVPDVPDELRAAIQACFVG